MNNTIRPIDGNQLASLLNVCNKYFSYESAAYIKETLYNVEKLVDEMPTLDYAPVIHARWIEEEETVGEKKFICSHCNSELCVFDDWTPPYCLQCGAKMDEESKNK